MTAAVLQIDTTNAFNSLNHNLFLHSIKVICPEISNFVIDCYTLPSLSESVHHSASNSFYNVAFPDDFTGCGKLESLKQWFGEICRLGPFIGYYANPTKTWLIVKDH